MRRLLLMGVMGVALQGCGSIERHPTNAEILEQSHTAAREAHETAARIDAQIKARMDEGLRISNAAKASSDAYWVKTMADVKAHPEKYRGPPITPSMTVIMGEAQYWADREMAYQRAVNGSYDY